MRSVSGLVRGGVLAASLGLSACAVYEPVPYYTEPAYSYYYSEPYYYPGPQYYPAPSFFSFSYVERNGGWGHGRRGRGGHWR